MAKKKDYSNHPYVSNYPPLRDWLEGHNAQCMWQLAYPSNFEDHGEYPACYVECYLFKGGRLAIVTVRSNKAGWDIFTPVESMKVDETLVDAEQRLGLKVPA